MIFKPDHPSAYANGYIPEHRLIAEQMLGRPVSRDERVKRLNGNKMDASPENLVVVPRKTPKSQETRRRQPRVDNGYVYIYKPDHPNARNGYIAEHRLVLEQKLERLLRPDEHCHHINGLRHDNRADNLISISRSEHRRLHHPDDHRDEQWRKKMSVINANRGPETKRKLSEAMKRIWAERRRHQ